MSARLKVLAACTLAAALLFALEHESEPEPPAPQTVEAPAPNIARTANTSRVQRVVLGRLFTVEVEGTDRRADAALSAALTRLEELDERLSEWRPGSDVWLVNARAGGEPVEVGEDAHAVLSRARSLSEATEGLYEPTLGPVRVLWPFGDPSRPLPLRADLEEALSLVGFARLSTVDAHTVRLEREGMRVALDGLGVAYAMEAAMAALEEHGVRRAVVRAGDDVLTRGEGERDTRVVVIANPRWPERVVERFTVADSAVATVDDMHGALVSEGLVLSAVLDPRSGEPARGCRSVTVVADDPLRARAFATAVFVRGAEAGLAWLAQTPALAALVVDAEGVVHRSASWSRLTTAVHARAGLARNTEDSAAQDSATARNSATRETDEADASLAAPSRIGSSETGSLERRVVATSASNDARLALIEGDPRVPPFRLDRSEVTNAQYERFLEAERASPHAFCHPEEPDGHDHTPRYHRRFSPRMVQASYAGALAPFDERTFRRPDHPVVGVDFWDAWAFARWSGKRLPTREELTRACAGDEGRTWPFGDTWDPAAVNSGGERDGEHDGHIYAAPAESFAAGASPQGCLHLAGNVAEWTARRWVVGGSSRSNPSGVACGAGRPREPVFRAFDVGFRCAADVGEGG